MIERIEGVVCCGNICYDMPVWPVDRVAWGATTWVERIEHSVGGNGANTSYALARLGTPVKLFGMVGSDAPGETVLAMLREAGVDTAGVRRSDLPTAMTVCVVHPSGDRFFLHKVGASTHVSAEMVEFAGGSHFHLANLFALPGIRPHAASLLARAKAAGLTTSLDTGWDARGEWWSLVGPCLAHTDLLFVNETEAKMLTGVERADDAAVRLCSAGAAAVVLKLGAAGCGIFMSNGRVDVPGFAVSVVDTTGAGDCFAGGFLAALHRGLAYREAAVIANAVGAMNVQCLGAAQGVRGYEATLDWIRSKLEASS